MMLLNIRYKKLGLFRSSYKIDNCQQWNENTANLNLLNKSNWENNVCRKYSKTRCLNRTGEIEGTFSCELWHTNMNSRISKMQSVQNLKNWSNTSERNWTNFLVFSIIVHSGKSVNVWLFANLKMELDFHSIA